MLTETEFIWPKILWNSNIMKYVLHFLINFVLF